jgi:hypothetical protein
MVCALAGWDPSTEHAALNAPTPPNSIDRDGSDRHFCPVCLHNVSLAEAQRRAQREACGVYVLLLHCPACDVVLAAEVDAGESESEPAAA